MDFKWARSLSPARLLFVVLDVGARIADTFWRAGGQSQSHASIEGRVRYRKSHKEYNVDLLNYRVNGLVSINVV